MNNYMSSIKNYKLGSLIVAVIMGILLKYLFVLAKNFMWQNPSHVASTIASNIQSETVAVIVTNLLFDITSSLVADIVIGIVFVYLFKKTAFPLCIVTVIVFLLSVPRLWYFWKAPDIGMQISSLLGPFLTGGILILTILVLRNIFFSSPSLRQGP